MCKDGYRYNYEDIFPLQAIEHEGVAAKVLSSSASVLTKEYSVGSLNNIVYRDYRFIADLGRVCNKQTIQSDYVRLDCLD